MPWHISEDHPDCSGYAVVKDDDNSVAGCHETRAEAEKQLAALYANEGNMSIKGRRWSTPVALLVEGEQTGDGRFIVEGATDWMDLPLPLIPEHGSQESVGNVTSIERKGKYLVASGVLDDQSERGREVARQMDEGTAPMGNRWGVSIEPDNYSFEIVDTAAVEAGDEVEIIIASALSGDNAEWAWQAGHRFALSARSLIAAALLAAAGDGEPDGVVVHSDSQDSVIERITRLRIRALALTTTPAFADAYIELDAVDMIAPAGEPVDEIAAALSAAAAYRFERAAFEQPEPDYVTPLTINEDGTWFAHVHEQGACHVGYPGRCVAAPPSPTGYEYFNRTGGVVDLQDGASIRVAPFMFDINHAPLTHTVEEVTAHYDPMANTECVFGFGRVREGRHGPFACGVLRPDLSTERLTLLKACGQVSGDWRNGELYACQAVPRPGFPIMRMTADGAYTWAGAEYVMTASTSANHSHGHCEACSTRESQMLEALYELHVAKPARLNRWQRAREALRR